MGYIHRSCITIDIWCAKDPEEMADLGDSLDGPYYFILIKSSSRIIITL
jgi:hypothetical protein